MKKQKTSVQRVLHSDDSPEDKTGKCMKMAKMTKVDKYNGRSLEKEIVQKK